MALEEHGESGRLASGVHSSAGLWFGAFWLALAVLAAVPVFHGGIAALLEAWQRPEYSHGPLIPLISGYLFLRQMKGVPSARGPVPDRWPGALLMLASLALAFAGRAAGIPEIVAYALILWVGGVVLASFGWRRGRGFWPPVLHLAFMLPLPGVLYWKVSIALQLLSSEIGVGLIRLAGVPVFLDGNIIDLHSHSLHVAEACSGLRYLFPVMSFTYVFAVLYRGPLWLKGTLLLAAVPIAVLMNALRVGLIGIMVDAYGISHAEGAMHLFEGWVVFGLCIAAMVGLAWALKRLSGNRRRLLDVLDLDMEGLGSQLARIGDIRPSAALLGPSLVLALAAGAATAAPLLGLVPQPAHVARDPFALFPRALGEWRTVFRPDLPPRVAATLGADDYLSARLERPSAAAPVDLFVAWYRDQGRGGIHSPEICLPGSGWEITEMRAIEVHVGNGAAAPRLPVNRAVIRKGLSRQLVYYWFDQRGRRLTSDYAAKAYLFWDGVITGRTDGALVRLSTPIGEGEDEAAAEARLAAVLAAAMPAMPRFIDTEWDTGDG